MIVRLAKEWPGNHTTSPRAVADPPLKKEDWVGKIIEVGELSFPPDRWWTCGTRRVWRVTDKRFSFKPSYIEPFVCEHQIILNPDYSSEELKEIKK